jgi:hypothetical protein
MQRLPLLHGPLALRPEVARMTRRGAQTGTSQLVSLVLANATVGTCWCSAHVILRYITGTHRQHCCIGSVKHSHHTVLAQSDSSVDLQGSKQNKRTKRQSELVGCSDRAPKAEHQAQTHLGQLTGAG